MAYLPLSTANLPDPVIDPAQGASPEDYFNTVLYTGTGATQSITGVGFEPDWIWIHPRNDTGSHVLSDVVRGEGNSLWSDRTDAEQVNASNGQIESHDVDGFTVGNNAGIGNVNGSGDSVVAWNWKANGSGVTNTDGSITSTVSANTTSGFSIVSWTATGGADTIGHGLDTTPDFIITKRRNSADTWYCYTTVIDGSLDILQLNSTAAKIDSGATPPTSTVFSRGSTSGDTLIAYCFHSVEGFSKFGSYVGNGSADGPFVYTGFRPAFILYKASSNITNWGMNDAARNTYNVVNEQLLPNSSGTTSTSNAVDYLSNGFKLRSSDANSNASGYTYIYMAFAENPFKYSNAR